MTGNPKDDRESLDRLAAAMIDDILEASDEDLIAEILEEGSNPTAEAEAMRGVIERAARECGKSLLREAKAAIAAAKDPEPKKVFSLDAAAARRKLAAILTRDPLARGLSMAARKESELSDSDVFGMLADIEEVEALPEDEDLDSET